MHAFQLCCWQILERYTMGIGSECGQLLFDVNKRAISLANKQNAGFQGAIGAFIARRSFYHECQYYYTKYLDEKVHWWEGTVVGNCAGQK